MLLVAIQQRPGQLGDVGGGAALREVAAPLQLLVQLAAGRVLQDKEDTRLRRGRRDAGEQGRRDTEGSRRRGQGLSCWFKEAGLQRCGPGRTSS